MAGNAIQRWYVYSTGPVEFEKCIFFPESPPQKWVRDEDAQELERVIAERSISHDSAIEGLRRQLDRKNYQIGRLEDNLRTVQRAAISGMDAAKTISSHQLQQAAKLRAESNPDALESERAMNSQLTNENTRLEAEVRRLQEYEWMYKQLNK